MSFIRSDIRFIIVALTMLWGLGTCSHHEPTLQSGDLVFQASNSSEFARAINNAAHNPDSLVFCHVGIIEADSAGKINVIEAVPHGGVRIVSLHQFLCESDSANGKPLVAFKRITADFNRSQAIERAKLHIGEPYDSAFMPDNGMTYCSELVYDAFLDTYGKHLFQSTPMNFCDSTGKISQYWIKKYAEMDLEVPQGKPGTHPNTLSQSEKLVAIDLSF